MIGKFLKFTVVLTLLAMFSTLAFAATEVEVTAVKLEFGVEVTWSDLSQYEGMDVWCAAYDTNGKMLAVKQAEMIEGQACRIDCDPQSVASVKLFILGEQLQPAQDAKMPEHIHVWETTAVTQEPTFLEAGEGQCVCACGETGEMVAIPPASTPEERVLVDQALDLGLLQYVCDDISEIRDLGEATRLDVAKMLPIVAEFDNYDEIQPSSTTKYADCADLTDMEKGILNAVSGFMTGDGNGNFKPHAKVTRAELAYVFFRAMGHPYPNEVTTYTDVAEGAWYHKEVTYLHSLGLLDDEPEFRPTDNATKADLLKWFSNGVLWAGDLTDRMMPSNLRFDAETNGKWLYWDGAKSELRNLWYVIGMRNANTGRWEDMEWIRADEESEYGICTRWRFAGEYDRVSIMAQTENGKPYGGMGRDMSMTIYRDENTDAEVKLVDTDNGRALKITNLPANMGVRVILVTEPGDFGNYNDEWSRRTDDNGELLIYEADYDTDFFSNELWYAIESFGDYTLSSDGMELKYTVTCYGEGHFDPSTGIGTNDPVSDPDYEVGNVYFDMFMGEVPVMNYTLPAGVGGEDVRVDLYIPDGNGGWKRAMGSNRGYFWVDWLKPGVYDRFKVVTTVDDEEKGWVIVDDLKLTINPGGVSNAQVTFEKIDNTYHWKAINGQPETCFSIEVVEEGAGSFRPTGYFEEDGVGDGTESGSHAISHIENGTFVLREYRDLEISDRNLTVSVWATEEKNCLPMDPAYAVTNLHFEKNKNGMLFIVWDAPAAVTGENYVEYAFQFYRAGDNSKNDWNGQTNGNRLAMWKFGATNYDRLYVKTIVDGVAKGEKMFQGNLVTITEGTAPNVQLTYTQTGHDYEMQLVGSPNTCYVVTYQNPRNSILTTEYVTGPDGTYAAKINGNFYNDCIENGSINVMTYGNLSYSGSSCSYTANATGWMKGSDMIIAAPNNAAYAVSNVRFGITGGGISLLFDEPENVTGELTYDLYMVEAETGRKYGRGSSYSKPDQLNYFFLGSYDEGVYEDMVIYTYVDGELKSWIELEDYCLNLEYNGESDARADFVFTGESENKAYDYTVSGTPNGQFAIEMRNANGSTNHFGTLDASGRYTRTGVDGENTTSRIESGNCFVREYDELNISADGSKCDVIYRDSATWKCLRGYGYVTHDIELVINEKGEKVNLVTFWNGEEDMTVQAKHRLDDLLVKDDFFSYRLEVRDDGELCLDEIIKNDGKVGEVTACGAGMTPEWIELDGIRYDCVEPPILVYVDGEEREGVLTEDYSIETGKSIRYVLNDVGKIAAVFVDVTGDINTKPEGGDQTASGYVIDLSLDGPWMNMTLTAPESANPDINYTYMIYNSANDELRYFDSVQGARSVRVIPRTNGHYDSYRVLLHDDDLMLHEQRVLGEGRLTKHLTVNKGEFGLVGITVTKGHEVSPNLYRYHFAGMDFSKYAYKFDSNSEDYCYVENAETYLSGNFFSMGAFIEAAVVEETADEYVMDISSKYEVHLTTEPAAAQIQYGYVLQVAANTADVWDGSNIQNRIIASDYVSMLNAGDFVSYSLNDAGEMTDIVTDIGRSAAVIGIKFHTNNQPSWLSLSHTDTTQLRADCAQDCVIIYVDTQAGTGVADGLVVLSGTPNIRYVLNDNGEIEVLFVAVNGNIDM